MNVSILSFGQNIRRLLILFDRIFSFFLEDTKNIISLINLGKFFECKERTETEGTKSTLLLAFY